MDLRLPGTNGTDTVIEIRGQFPDARIIMLSMSDGDAEIQRAIRAGATLLSTQQHAERAAAGGVPGGARRPSASCRGGRKQTRRASWRGEA